jgi:hypothetical protein
MGATILWCLDSLDIDLFMVHTMMMGKMNLEVCNVGHFFSVT